MTRRNPWIGLLAGLLLCASPIIGCSGKGESGSKGGDKAQPDKPDPDKTKTEPATPTTTAPKPVAAKPLAPLQADPGGNEGKHVWSRRLGSMERDGNRGLAMSDSGEVVVSGYYSNDADLGDGKPTPASEVDAYITMYKADGTHGWTVHFGGKGEDVANGVAFDAQGNVLVTGQFSHEVTIGETKLTGAGSDDAFLVKISPEGQVMWASQFGGINSDAGYDITSNDAGEVVVTGSFKGGFKAAGEQLKSKGNEDIFVLKLDADGGLMWVKQFGYRYKDFGRRVVVDVQGNIVLLVEFSGEVEFGGDTLKTEGNQDLALVKLGPSGEHVWSKRFGSPFNELGLGLAVDPAGNIAITGSFDNEISFGGDTLKSQGESDVFVARFDAAGKHLWSRGFGAAREDVGYGIALDRYGNVAVGGWFWHKVDFGGGPLEAPEGNKDGFLIKLSATGEHLWSKRFGSRDHDQIRGVAMAADGRVAASGLFRFKLEAGGEALESARKPDDKAPPADVFAAVFDR